MSLNHKLTLPLDLGSLSLFFCRQLDSLLLECLDGDDVHLDHFGGKPRVYLNLFIFTEYRLVDFLKQDLYLGVAKFHHCTSEVFLWHV